MPHRLLAAVALALAFAGCERPLAPPYEPPAPAPDPNALTPVEGGEAAAEATAAVSPIPNLLAPSGWQTRTGKKGDWYAVRQPSIRNVRTVWVDSNGRKIKLSDGVTAEQAAFNFFYNTSERSGIVWRLVPKNQAQIRINFGTPAQLRERSRAYGTLGGGQVSENVAWRPGNPEVWIGTRIKSNHPTVSLRGKPLGSTSVTRAVGKGVMGFWGWRYNEGIVAGDTYLEMNMSHPIKHPNGGFGRDGTWLGQHMGPGWLAQSN